MNDIEKRLKSYEPVFGVYETIPNPDGDGLYSLGEGSFGQVFAMRHIRNAHHCIALKVISIPKDKGDENYIRLNSGGNTEGMARSINAYVDRYAKEIDILKSLDDVSTVVKYKDFDIRNHNNGIGKDILISMELLTSLDMILLNDAEEYHITVNDIVHLGIDMCDALVNLQKYNIVHRDIKPSNIFVSPKGVFKLGDFGTAKVSLNRETSSERGTPVYAAPEVIKREKIDAGDTRCDIYSLGIVLYILMNDNMPPFITRGSRFGEENEALSRRLNGESLPPPSRSGENKRLTEIVMKACQYEPHNRYDSAVQMKADLEAVCDDFTRRLIPRLYEFESEPAESTALIPIDSSPVQAEQREQGEQKTVKAGKETSGDTKKASKKNILLSVSAIAIILSLVGYALWQIIPGSNIPANSLSNDTLTETETSEQILAEPPTEEITEVDEGAEQTPILKESPAEHFEYATTKGQATITKYAGNMAHVVIPPQINGLPVTGIGESAFENYQVLGSVTIPDGVTSIGKGAFRGCTNLKTVTMPDSVVSIGENAFRECKSLIKITLPSGIKSIEYSLFRDCKSLKEIIIPDGVTTIGESAFRDSSNLTAVTISSSVTSIEDIAFWGTGLTTITISESVAKIGSQAFFYTKLISIDVNSDNTTYSSENGVLFNKKKTILIQYPSAKSGDSYTIPNSVTKVENIAFSNCKNLKSIEVANGNTAYSSDGGILFNNNKTILVRYPNAKSEISYVIPDGVTSIGNNAFEECRNLRTISIPESVTSIEDSAFSLCENLKEITIPTSVTSIGNSAFWSCSKLSKAYFEHSNARDIKKFGGSVFDGTAANFKIIYPKDAMGFTSPKWKSYAAQSDTVSPVANFEYIAENGKVTIAKYTGKETAVAIPAQIDGLPVTEIGKGAFEEYKALSSVTIPNSVVSIGEGAFRNCTGLKEVVIPSSVMSIGDWAFWYCTSLTTITIPTNTNYIGWEALVGCTSLAAINVEGGNVTYSSDGGVLFDKAKTKLISYPSARNGNEYTVPNSVAEITGRAFFGSKNLNTITIPSSVTEIGYNAFEFCANLTAIDVNSGNKTYSSDSGVLFSKAKNKIIRYPSAKSENSYAVPDSVITIGNDTFANCENLTAVTIPVGVTSMGEGTFRDCKNLRSVYFEGEATQIVDGEGNKRDEFQSVPENTTIHYNYQTITGNLLYDKFLANKFAEMRDVDSLEPNSITRYSLMDFRLIDFDDNGIPELWYAGRLDVEPAWLYVPIGFCTIIDGEVVELLTGGQYYEGAIDIITAYNTELKKHVIGTCRGYIDNIFTWYTMDNGKLTKIDEFYYGPENESKEMEKYIDPIDNRYALPSYEDVKAMFTEEMGW